MVYIFGTLEDKLSVMFSGYAYHDQDFDEENLDTLIEKRINS